MDNLRLNQIVWLWIRPQHPDVGIIVKIISDQAFEKVLSISQDEHTLSKLKPAVVLVNGKLYIPNRYRLWQTELEAINAGPPLFLPRDVDE